MADGLGRTLAKPGGEGKRAGGHEGYAVPGLCQFRISARIMSAAFSPIMMLGALVLPPIRVGMIEASTTRKPSTPYTFSFGSTTAMESLTPILQVPTG